MIGSGLLVFKLIVNPVSLLTSLTLNITCFLTLLFIPLPKIHHLPLFIPPPLLIPFLPLSLPTTSPPPPIIPLLPLLLIHRIHIRILIRLVPPSPPTPPTLHSGLVDIDWLPGQLPGLLGLWDLHVVVLHSLGRWLRLRWLGLAVRDLVRILVRILVWILVWVLVRASIASSALVHGNYNR